MSRYDSDRDAMTVYYFQIETVYRVDSNHVTTIIKMGLTVNAFRYQRHDLEVPFVR